MKKFCFHRRESGRPQRQKVVFVFAALLLVVLLSGCDLAPKKVVKKKLAKKPLTVVKALDLPMDWPKEIPIYPGVKLLETTSTVNGSKALSFKTMDSADKVFSWYYDTLEAAKWEMKGPTLDVGQNIAIIKSKLNNIDFLLDTRTYKDPAGKREGSKIILTTPSPYMGGP